MKVWRDGLLAVQVAQYVDDVRIVVPTREIAWTSSSQIEKGLCWRGLQDAARKRWIRSKRPGAWVGSVVSTDGPVVMKGVTKEQWKKVQDKVRWLGKHAGLSDKYSSTNCKSLGESKGPRPGGKIHSKTTERYVEFLV